MQRAVDGVAPGHVLEGEALELLRKYAQGAVGGFAVEVLDAAGGVGGRNHFVAETGRPHGEGGHGHAVAGNRRPDVHDITVIEVEGLADGNVGVRVFEGDVRGSGERTSDLL